MKFKKLHLALMACGTVFCNIASAQLFIDQATFTIQSGATVTVQGDVTSNVDILGTGKVVLKGTANQNVNMNGFSIPNVEVDNTSNVTLTGNAKVAGDLLFTNGKVLLGNNTLSLASAGTITGATSAKYVVTNGTGRLLKAALGAAAFTFPIGNSTTVYNPLSVSNSGTADSIGATHPGTIPMFVAKAILGEDLIKLLTTSMKVSNKKISSTGFSISGSLKTDIFETVQLLSGLRNV